VIDEDFGMSGRFGFAPGIDLTIHDRCCTFDGIVTGIAVYAALALLHLPWTL